MNDSPTSGSRWEPATGGDTTTAVVDQPAPVPTYDAPQAPARPRRTVRERLGTIPRSALAAGVAAFLVVATGFGGFAVGRATAPDGGAQQPGVTAPGDRDGFQGGPGRDFPGQDQQGTFPGGATGSNS